MIKLHSAVLLFALAGLFAKWLPLSAYWLVLGRTSFAAITLFVFLFVTQRNALKIGRSDIPSIIFSGVLLLLHWLTFFYAIQLSTVAFGLLVFASFPIFTLIISAITEKTLPTVTDYLQAIAMVLGIGLLVWDSGLVANLNALLMGLSSALTFALLLTINKALARQYRSATIASYQNLVACLFALPFIGFAQEPLHQVYEYLPELIMLGVVFTALAHSLLTSSLRLLSTFMVSLAICLEPVYGTVAAVLLLNETLTLGVILGGTIILSVNFYHALTSNN
ncbi:EamA family transporter [Thalassotalea sp. M1531]|uniref:EamA family transporter n=1 Tax=Thalassotalea algicola TaxID=2716224 RepID=A0A7Y0LA26_9GAMM|nr:DMT family transporter [Thalassotalea algicola]NMP30735.1 EamA family transporter [Thalassotalea algicola]